MKTNTVSDRCRNILDEMGRIPVIIPGKLCPRHGKDGKATGWKLQRWHAGRNETRHIPADWVASVQAGTQGHERFMVLAREYADTRGKEALGELRGPEDSKKKRMKR